MKTILLAGLLSLPQLVLAQAGGSVRRLDEANGFRGVHFGTPLSEGQHLKLVRENGDEKTYERTDEDLHVGAFNAYQIHYKFIQGKFAAVTIIVKGADNAARVLPTFQTAYGPGVSEGFGCKWKGQLVGLTYASWSADNAILAMSSLPLTTAKQLQTQIQTQARTQTQAIRRMRKK